MFTFALALMLSTATTPSVAWTSVYREEAENPEVTQYRRIVPAGNNGYWVHAVVNDNAALIRLDASFTVMVAREIGRVSQLRPLADGGVMTSSSYDSADESCTVRRYDASGLLRWEAPTTANYCFDLQVDGADSAWIRGGYTRSDSPLGLGVDGAARVRVESTTEGVYFAKSFAALPRAGGVYAVGSYKDASSDLYHGTMTRLDSRGRQIWRWNAPAQPVSFAFTHVAADAAGNVFVAGQPSNSPFEFLGVASLTPEGARRWFARIDAGDLTSIREIVPGQDGSMLVSGTVSGGALALLRFDSAGQLSWRYVGGTAHECDLSDIEGCPQTVFAMRDGETWVVTTRYPTSSTLTRVTATGQVRASVPFVDGDFASAAVTPSDEFITISRKTVDDVVRFSTITVDAEGRQLAGLQGLSMPATAGSRWASAIDRDAPAYLLTQSLQGDQSWISRVDQDGTRRWKIQDEGAWSRLQAFATISVGGDRVCVSGARNKQPGRTLVSCRAAATGAELWTRTILDTPDSRVPAIGHKVLADGTVIVVAADGTDLHHVVLAGNGALARDVNVAPVTPHQWVFAPDGSVLLVVSPTSFSSGSSRVMLLSHTGQVRYDVELSTLGFTQVSMSLTDNGAALLIGSRPSSNQTFDIVATRLDDHGAVAWSKTIDNTPSTVSAAIRQADGSAFVSYEYCCVSHGGFPQTTTRSALLRLNLDSGNVIWRDAFDAWTFRISRIELDATRTKVLLISGWPGRIRERVFDAAGGQLLKDDFLGCNLDDCLPGPIAADSSGTLRVVADTESVLEREAPRIYRLDNATAVADRTVARQPGIAGVWYAPYSSGQGLALEFDPASGTVFAPWFTFALAGGNRVEDLRWFSLQGVAAPSAQAVELGIYQNTGGQFASPPITQAARVGGATLEFYDCDNATLRYRFDAEVNGGREGLISLTRLTPRNFACRLANGNVDGVSAHAARDGFDSRQSGAWFDPATSGQGFMFTINPRANDDDGLVAGAWFTYDPADGADDPARQHWFTIQSSLAQGSNGHIAAAIYRTIGGRFDLTATSNTQRVGTADITFQGCAQASLRFQFDAADVALPFATRSGTIALQRIGGCAAAR